MITQKNIEFMVLHGNHYDELKSLQNNIFWCWKPNFRILGLIPNWIKTQGIACITI